MLLVLLLLLLHPLQFLQQLLRRLDALLTVLLLSVRILVRLSGSVARTECSRRRLISVCRAVFYHRGLRRRSVIVFLLGLGLGLWSRPILRCVGDRTSLPGGENQLLY